MVSYKKNELLSITDFTKSISKVLNDVKEKSLERVGILKNNRLEAVVISIEEYEKLKKLEEFIEHKEIYETLKNRQNESKESYLSLEEMAKKLDIDFDKV
ncbi:MAG: type II toxin-antitoxin system prevent-host-death family antitoxin [Arcobacteraceae bacterium]|jgi:prevent-host-death family protein|nr:type II toxin-antitoxin system Phd/YefM family antitoxin [Arcobacteraceae bacterium]MDY0364874.1 type II toxin-antitoxin system prevent-host-death family antitoxin [Arcobacteraceae bacterium]